MKKKAFLLATALLAGASTIGAGGFTTLHSDSEKNITKSDEQNLNNSDKESYVNPNSRIHMRNDSKLEVGEDYIAFSVMMKSTVSGVNTNFKPQITTDLLHPNIYIYKTTNEGIDLPEREMIYKLENKYVRPSRIKTYNQYYDPAYVTSKYMMPTYDIMITNDDIKGISVDDPYTKDDPTTNKDDVLALIPYSENYKFYWGPEEVEYGTVLSLWEDPLMDESLFNNQLETPPEDGLIPGETYEIGIVPWGPGSYTGKEYSQEFTVPDKNDVLKISQSNEILSSSEDYSLDDVSNKVAFKADYSTYEGSESWINNYEDDILITSGEGEKDKLVNDILLSSDDYTINDKSQPFYDEEIDPEEATYSTFSKKDGFESIYDEEYKFEFDEDDDYVYNTVENSRFRDVTRFYTNDWQILEFEKALEIFNQKPDKSNMETEYFYDDRNIKIELEDKTIETNIHPLKLLTILDNDKDKSFYNNGDWEDYYDGTLTYRYWLNFAIPNNVSVVDEYKKMYENILLETMGVKINVVDDDGNLIDDLPTFGVGDKFMSYNNRLSDNYVGVQYRFNERIPSKVKLVIEIDQYPDEIFGNINKDVEQQLKYERVVTVNEFNNLMYNKDGSVYVDISTPTLSADGNKYSLDLKMHRKEGDYYFDVHPDLATNYAPSTSFTIADLYESDITDSYKTSDRSWAHNSFANAVFNNREYGSTVIIDGRETTEVIDSYTLTDIPLGYDIILSTWLTTQHNTFVSHEQTAGAVLNPISKDNNGYKFNYKDINPYIYEPIKYYKDNSIVGPVQSTSGGNSITLEFDVNYDYTNLLEKPADAGFYNKEHSTYDLIDGDDIEVAFTPITGGETIYAEINTFIDDPKISSDKLSETIDYQHIVATAYGLDPHTTYNYEIKFNNNTFDLDNSNSVSADVTTLDNEPELLFKDFEYTFKPFDPTTIDLTVDIESKDSNPFNAKSAKLEGEELNEFTRIELINGPIRSGKYKYRITGLQAGKQYEDLELTIENNTQKIDSFKTKEPLQPSEPTISGFDYDSNTLTDKSVNLRYKYKLPVDEDEKYNLGHEEIIVDSIKVYDAGTNEVVSVIEPEDKTHGSYGSIEIKDLDPETEYSFYLKLNYHSETILATETSETINLTTKPFIPSPTNDEDGLPLWLIITLSITIVGLIFVILLVIFNRLFKRKLVVEASEDIPTPEEDSIDEDEIVIIPYSEQELYKMRVPELIMILVDNEIEISDTKKHKKADYINFILENELGHELTREEYDELDKMDIPEIDERKKLEKLTKDKLIIIALQDYSEKEVMGLTRQRLIDLILEEN